MYAEYAKIRDQKGLSDYAVAKMSGVGRSTLSEWKKGMHVPSTKNLQRIADILGVSIDTLCKDEKNIVLNVVKEGSEVKIEATSITPVHRHGIARNQKDASELLRVHDPRYPIFGKKEDSGLTVLLERSEDEDASEEAQTEHTEEDIYDNAYYQLSDAADIAQELLTNKDLRALLDAARDARPEDLKMVTDMLRRFKETNPDG